MVGKKERGPATHMEHQLAGGQWDGDFVSSGKRPFGDEG